MYTEKDGLIKKLKEELSSTELKELIKNLQVDVDSFLSDLQEEGSTAATQEFIEDFESTLSRIKSEFENHQSLFKSIINYNITFREFAKKLSRLEVSEIKFVLAYVLEDEEGELFLHYWMNKLRDFLPKSDYQLILQDERFGRFIPLKF